jgi:hypothetical protein
VSRGSGQTNELARGFKLLVLGAQALELEPEHPSSGLGQLPADFSASPRRDPLADRAPHHRQRLRGGVLEDRAERLRGVGAHELAERVADPVKDISEKLLELLFARHLEDLRCQLELLRLAQRDF